jgi:iron complex outermembrane receptor protein
MFERSRISAAVMAALGGVFVSVPAVSQAQGSGTTAQGAERVVVTGTRILRADLLSSSPMTTISGAQLQANQDITIETMLNALPQVNPAGTTTSNNPGNSGQANIDLRGLGAGRNLVLIDGRRPMVSAADQSVDLNTIPLALIDSIEVISGGAAAVYGADAVAGVVNIKLKRNFEGIDLRAGRSNAMDQNDAKEENFQLTLGGNFGGGKGNAALGFEYAKRQQLVKGQRDFAKVATSTTTSWPEGRWAPSGNSPTQAAVNSLFSGYGYSGPQIPRTSAQGFNSDGTLFYPGLFNSPLDVVNFRSPIDDGVNTKFYPDFYSYNFDSVNLLVLPLERRSFNGKVDYRFDNGVEAFARLSQTRYGAETALAPTPVGGITIRAPGRNIASQVSSPFVVDGLTPSGAQRGTTGLIVPVTNPFIPADLQALLATRDGDNLNLVGSGATEPIIITWRTVAAGLRKQVFENTVSQYLAGAKGPLIGNWTWEGYLSEGRTKIESKQFGNINAQRLNDALATADGGASLCAGGINPFGRQPLSPACVNYLQIATSTSTTFEQSIGQFFVSGDITELPAGPLSAVAGLEFRNFQYDFDPGTASGPIYGFNSQTQDKGSNSFRDVFGELAIPLLKNAPFARSASISVALRSSESKSVDEVQNLTSTKQRSNTFALNFDWSPTNELRTRASLQKSVRAPNFGELFSGGGAFPQIFDPCSINSAGRTTLAGASQLATLCGATDSPVTGNTTFVATPGNQAFLTTDGNRDLKPETGNSVTLGLVWIPRAQGFIGGLRGSIDYYQIKVKDAILAPDVNEIIADCYNYGGRNPSYDATRDSCAAIFRQGDNIAALFNPADLVDGLYGGTNGGSLETSGLDLALGWGGTVGPGKLDVQLNWTHLLSVKQRSAEFLPTYDYKGTIPFFGVGLGQAYPNDKMMVTAKYAIGDFTGDLRMRYIGKMDNRMSRIFPGERFTGVAATTYWDIGGTYEVVKGVTLRAGINNLLDQKPRTYAPNVQSGTDPSTYDVIGRRLFMQVQAQFK